MTQPLDFQSIMLTLERFWAEQGCLIWQPYYTQVGAGTLNPATSLRVLGPEPWNVAYVEPSVRPDDGRYGENPNRLQQHYQFQVILKPDPGNPQELYLKSLEALGIDPRQHDIRFVEDNWESPALGAWGLGWEVWLDGQEITQFTYFQQAGGMPLDPVAVEITYGLERIAMALQGVRNFRDLRWSVDRTYGDVNLQAEQEHSRYYFELADVDRVWQMYNLFEAEANAALEAGLVLPAHDYVLKCSHTFNILDTRGAVGVTERQALFRRMRDLSRKVAEAYVAQRRELGFPWPPKEKKARVSPGDLTVPLSKSGPQAFMLEIGVEELPAADLDSALAQLKERIPALLDELRLTRGDVRVLGTPRRLVVWVDALADSQPDREVVVKGPPADRAFDAQGQPTKAAEGFARSRGLAVTDLKIQEIDGGRYAAATVFEPGRPAVAVLSEALAGVVAGIKFDKTMRWNESAVAFSRPIRWLLALFGSQVVPFSYAGLNSDRITRGLRFHQPETFAVADPAAYFAALNGQGIVLDPAERKQTIAEQTRRVLRESGALEDLDAGLLDEVTQLVEAPTALRGEFDPAHLELPQEVLISVMKKHQRYFPVRESEGKLLPYFVAVRNGDEQALDVVADGNAQVVRARFADAAFFVREDLRQPLEAYLPRLSTLTFQVKLGSMLDKTARIQALVEKLIPAFGLGATDAETTRRAARLCKADLVTKMVVEMTSLQGVMGKFYALRSGETPAVAQAIAEHYSARPSTLPGLVLSVADRLDSLAGLFGAGLAPTGTKDPFAQRRSALGLNQALIAWDMDFDLEQGLRWAAETLPVTLDDAGRKACLDFITGRLQSALSEEFRYDRVGAVMAAQSRNPAGVARAARQLSGWMEREEWPAVLAAYARCVRITRDQSERYTPAPATFTTDAEADLFAALTALKSSPRRAGSVDDLFAAFEPVIPIINRFFEAVMVMSDQPTERANRLGLLQEVAALTEGVADLSLVEGF